ncbi:hypothetical protein C7N43_33045 [Sphingobacteriales bacterium UPWRP_1]|nr:hypothetical protein C7N43_33045 [Sphingobacteriales bacterium UPWRP_1]
MSRFVFEFTQLHFRELKINKSVAGYVQERIFVSNINAGIFILLNLFNMKQLYTIVLYAFFALATVFPLNRLCAQGNPAYVDGSLFVKLNNTCDVTYRADNPVQCRELANNFPEMAQLWKDFGVTTAEKAFRHLPNSGLSDVYLVHFQPDILPARLIAALQLLNYVQYAEQVPVYRLFCTPNDPMFTQQWSWQNTFTEEAFDILLGGTCNFDAANCGSEVVVAVIDNAVLITHQDLAPNLWVNPGEIPGNGLDDDGNGYADDLNGWDAADNDNNPTAPPAFDHGSHVAGIVAAATNNTTGIASVGYKSKIMAVKCSSNSGDGNSLPAAYLGVEYAIAAGANILSMSWGGGAFSQTYQDLFTLAHNQGIMCIAAAGNDAVSIPMYPASYDHVLSVGATAPDDQITYFSNYGTTIDIMAPGLDILSALSTNNSAYGELSGTSMACPFVSGVAALMLCYNNALTPDEVETCIKNNATNIDAQNPEYIGQIGAGLINVQQIVNCLQVPPVAGFTIAYEVYCPGEPIAPVNLSSGPPVIGYNWSFPGGTPASSTAANPSVSYAAPGTYTISLTATNSYGSHTTSQSVVVGTPQAVLSGNTTVVEGMTATLMVTWNGSLPYNLTYTNGSNSYTITGIAESPWFIPVSPADTVTYTLVSAGNIYCNANLSGTAVVNVFQTAEGELCRYSSYYGTTADNTGWGIYTPADETIFLLGANPFTALISATNGEVLWSKNYPGLTNGASGAVRTPDGGLLISSGTPWNFDSDWIGYRISASGNLVWAKQYTAAGRQVATNIVASNADSYFIYGWYNNTGGTSDDFGILKIDGNGNQLASVAVSLGGDDQMGGAIPDGAGGIIISGEIEHNKTLVIMHFDANLNVLSENQYQLPFWASSQNIARHPNGGYVVTMDRDPIDGESWQDFILLKLDAAMNVEWVRSFYPTIGNILTEGKFRTVLPLNDAIYLTGYWLLSGTDFTPFVMKFDNNGNLLWTKTPQNNQKGYFNLYYNSATPQAPFVVVGYLRDGPFGMYDRVVIRGTDVFDSCILTDMSVIVATQTISPIGISHTLESPLFVPTDLSSATQDYLINRDTPCIECEPASLPCNFTCDFTASGNFACEGETVVFTTDCTGSAYSYAWTLNDTLLFSDADTAAFAFAQTGIYTIDLLVSDGLCTNTASHSVEIGSATAYAGPDAVVCPGDSVQLIASGGGGYSWFPATGLSCTNCPNPVAAVSGNTTYYLTVTAPNGCTATDSVTVWVAPLPSLLPMSADTTLCLGEDTVFMPLFEGSPISNYTYQWFPATGLSCTNCIDPVAAVTGSITYTLTLTNSFGCSSTQSIIINVQTVDSPVVNGAETCQGGLLPPVWASAGTGEQVLWFAGQPTGSTEPPVAIGDTLPQIVIPMYVNTDTAGTFYFWAVAETADLCRSNAVPVPVTITQAPACDDNDCNTTDTFDALTCSCLHTPVAPPDCNDNDCNTSDSYDAATCSCLNTPIPPPDCNDNDATTDDAFDPQTCTCVHTPVDGALLIPNAFSPNGDGVNDVFRITGYLVQEVSLTIYNRWGNKVFTETGAPLANHGWNGMYREKEALLGVYVYYATVVYTNGTTQKLKGNVTLIR